jgi:5-carboxymethyl-2-hydroxymuconate isomerase
VDNKVYGVGQRLGLDSVDAWLRAGRVPALAPQVSDNVVSFDDAELLLPLRSPEKIICVGMNYPMREEEYCGKANRGSFPNLFVRFPRSFSPHRAPIVMPSVSEQLDYEGEVALVIGDGGRAIPAAEALTHVAGLTLANEGSVRDWMRHGTLNVTQGKNFDASGGLGPYLVTTDEIDLSRPLTLRASVNGEVRQSDSTARLHWGFAELIAYISTFTTLVPGDLILTGSPAGAGGHRTPPSYLKPGDVVSVEIDGMAPLVNPVVGP